MKAAILGGGCGGGFQNKKEPIVQYFLYYSNQLLSFFLSKLIVHSFYIELSFASIHDIILVSACRANIFACVINDYINIFIAM